MKRLVSVTISLFLLLSCVACKSVPKTVDEACSAADEMVDKWDRDAKNLCAYNGFFYEEQFYIVEVTPLTVADSVDFAKMYDATTASEFVYSELKPIFEDFPEVSIAVSVLDENKHIYYLTQDGIPVNLEK